jgi:hypothetical protein
MTRYSWARRIPRCGIEVYASAPRRETRTAHVAARGGEVWRRGESSPLPVDTCEHDMSAATRRLGGMPHTEIPRLELFGERHVGDVVLETADFSQFARGRLLECGRT